jgi:hypothetical protein
MTSAESETAKHAAGTSDRAPLRLGRFGVWASSQTASPELAIAAESPYPGQVAVSDDRRSRQRLGRRP